MEVRLTNCVECTTIAALLSDIDCKLTELGKVLYNNTVYSLNQPIQASVFTDLLNYKRILTYRTCNDEYALPYTLEQIASKVKLLKFK
jgi:hypothetical protein